MLKNSGVTFYTFICLGAKVNISKKPPTSLVCLLWQDDLSHPVLRPVPRVQVFHVVYVHVHLVVTKMKSTCLALKQSKREQVSVPRASFPLVPEM